MTFGRQQLLNWPHCEALQGRSGDVGLHHRWLTQAERLQHRRAAVATDWQHAGLMQ